MNIKKEDVMKNLFVMLVVLALVAAASAGTISLSASKTSNISLGETITITIVADCPITGGDIATQIQTTNLSIGSAMTVSLNSALTLVPQAGTIQNTGSVLVGYINPGNLKIGGSIGIGAPAISAGTALWTMTWKADSSAYGSATISATETSVYDDAEEEITSISSVTIHTIPEPMTIALLGLGGLFLRRKLS